MDDHLFTADAPNIYHNFPQVSHQISSGVEEEGGPRAILRPDTLLNLLAGWAHFSLRG